MIGQAKSTTGCPANSTKYTIEKTTFYHYQVVIAPVKQSRRTWIEREREF